MNRIKLTLKVILTLLTLTISAILALAIAIITLFKAKHLIHKIIVVPISKIILWIFGISYKVHGCKEFPKTQTVYISNHSSTIDTPILCALDLPKVRYFFSTDTLKYIPITIISCCIGVFYIVTQDKPNKRTKTFMRAEKILRQTGESVFLTPEGERIRSSKIGKFNKGSFHLATNLKAPVVPIFINIPKSIDPGIGYNALPGHVDVYILPRIETKDWSLDDLEKHVDQIRNIYVEFHQKLRNESCSPGLHDECEAILKAS